MRNGNYEFVIPPKEYPGKRYRGKYAYEHHVNFWKWFNYKILPGWEIHHRDHNHRNNHIDNLQLVTSQAHRLLHGLANTKASTVNITCPICLKVCSILKSVHRTRMNHSKFGKLFCSQSCGAIHQFNN